MRIEVEELSYAYGESKNLQNVALDGISLCVEEGEFFGIIGQTGSGKTTFIQHLNGLIKANKTVKKLKVGEFDLLDKKCDFKGLRAKLGMVFQYPEYQLFAETVFDDVAFGVKNFMPSVDQKDLEEMVRSAIETVGLNYEKIKDKSPFELSGGQKRRVAIAGVIVTKPEVLVLDEPVAGLDPRGKREFMALLHQLHNSFVKTIVLVSHDMDLVAENCTRAVVFSHGKIVIEGAPKDIFKDESSLLELGLSIPVTAYLQRELEEKGVKIDSDLTSKDFMDCFIDALNKGDK